MKYIKKQNSSILDFSYIPHQEHELSQDDRKYEWFESTFYAF